MGGPSWSEAGRALSVGENRNLILRALDATALEFVQSRLHTRATSQGEVIYEAGASLSHAIFPHDGLISFMAPVEKGRSVEKTSIGREGLIGHSLAVGDEVAASRSVVQIPGHASWLSRTDLEHAMERFPIGRESVLRYTHRLVSQLLETVTCNTLHNAEQRIVRWLLHAAERVSGETLELTQQALADVLGLRRATVSEACSRLEKDGLVHHRRGRIRLAHPQRLEQRACDCYRRISLRYAPTGSR